MKYVQGSGKAGSVIPGYDTFYQWNLDGTTLMSDPSRGWTCQSLPTHQGFTIIAPADWPPGYANGVNDNIFYNYGGTLDSVTPTWAGALALNAAMRPFDAVGNPIDISAGCGNYIYMLQSGGDYYVTAWGALRLGKLNGMLRTENSLAFLDANMPAFLGNSSTFPTGYLAGAQVSNYGYNGCGVAEDCGNITGNGGAKWSVGEGTPVLPVLTGGGRMRRR